MTQKKQHCPVCKLNVKEPLPEFCAQCGWELKTDITLVPSIDLPDEVLAAYERKLKVAREKWTELKAEREKSASLEERLGRIESLQEKLLGALEKSEAEKKEIRREQKAEKFSAPAKPVPQASEAAYSEKTPVPKMTRDSFEMQAEFVDRINSHPPVPAGRGELVKHEYDIATGRFPLEIIWEDWPLQTANKGGPLPTKGYIRVDQEAARAIFKRGSEYTLYARLNVRGGVMKIDKFELSDGKWALPVTFAQGKRIAGEVWAEPATGIEFVWVPGGVFRMGDVFGEGVSDEKPIHEVELDSFWIGKFPLTVAQWQFYGLEEVIPQDSIGWNCSGMAKPEICQAENHPVVCVSWYETKAFTDWLSQKSHISFHLPTEAQWEYAARSGGKLERYAGGSDIEKLGWYNGNSNNSTHPVGKKMPNGLGIYDMSGNVMEWCEDVYAGDAYQKHGRKNPKYTEGKSNRVFRGGSWRTGANYARCTSRFRLDPSDRYDFIGFRLLMTI